MCVLACFGYNDDNSYFIMKVKRILLCGFFQTVCGVKHERMGLAHGENELTVALHGCRKRYVSATNCLFTLTSHRGRRMSHRSRRLKRYVLPQRINSTFFDK